MDVLRGPYYSFSYRVLYVTGQWPYLSKSQKWLRTSVTLFMVLSLLIPLCLGQIKAVRLNDFNAAVEDFSPFIVTFMGTLLFINFTVHNHKLAILLEKIQKDWEIWSVEPEIKILKNYAIRGKTFRMAFSASIMGTTTCFLLTHEVNKFLDWVKPLNESRPELPIYYTEFGVDNGKYYNIIFLHNFLTTYLAVFILLHTDMIFMVCPQHACSISAAIGFKLSNLVKNELYCLKQGKDFQKSVINDINFCIKQHNELIRFLQDIHNCFSSVYFFVMLLNMFIISVTGVAMVMNLNHPAVAIKYMAENCGQMAHMFLLTIPCEQMSDHSSSISASIYKSDWYTLPVHARRLLLMIMRRSSEPCQFICGKLYTFSMKNFATMMRTAFSYFTVLLSAK